MSLSQQSWIKAAVVAINLEDSCMDSQTDILALPTCSRCGAMPKAAKPKKGGGAKMPFGWKEIAGTLYCKKCKASDFGMRGIVLPVLRPIGMEWPAFDQAMRSAWSQSTCLANWCVQRLMAAETPRLPGQEKMPPPPRVYLYPEARELFPALDTQTLNGVIQYVTKRWNKQRLECHWLRKISPPTYDYPAPLPIPWKRCRLEFEDGRQKDGRQKDGRLLLTMPLGESGRVQVQLDRSFRFARQVGLARRILAGEIQATEVSVYRRNVHGGAGEARANGGGNRTRTQTFVRISAWLPRQGSREASGIMTLSRGETCLWHATVRDREEPWVENADHVRRWLTGHKRRLERISQDCKWEVRVPNRRLVAIRDQYRKLSEAHARRIDDYLHQLTRRVANFAARQNVAKVVYDESETTYLASFPWARARVLLKEKLDALRIMLCEPGGSDETDA